MFHVAILVLLLFRGVVCAGLLCVFGVLFCECGVRLTGVLLMVQLLFGFVLGCVVGMLGYCLGVRSVVQVR